MQDEQKNSVPLPESHVDAQGDTTSGSTPSTPTQPKRGWWVRVLAIVFALLLMLVIAAFSAAQSERGTQMLWKATKVLTGGKIQSQWVSGSLAHGGSAESIQIHLSTVHIDIHNVSGEWRWRLLPVHWQVDRLGAQRVDIALFPSEKVSEPTQQVLMPFAFTVNDLSVPEVNLIQGLKTTVLRDVSGSLNTDKVQHTINLKSLRQGNAEYTGQLAINGKRPFALDGEVDASVHDGDNSYSAKIIAKGDLKRLNLGLSADSAVQGSQGQLNGQGTLSVQLLDGLYIHQGHMDFKHVNPKLFWDSLPKADLDVALDADPSGASATADTSKDTAERQPVQGRWTLVNHLPLTLAELGIPVVSGQGQFTLTDKVQNLNDMQVVLFGGGSLNGNGQFANRQGQIDVAVTDLNLKSIYTKLLNTALDGTVRINIDPNFQNFVGQLAQSGNINMRINTDVTTGGGLIDIKQFKIGGLGAAELNLVGKIKQNEEAMPFEGKLNIQQFNLHDLGDFPRSQLAGAFDVSGAIKPNFKLDMKGELTPSRWADANAKGQLDFTFQAPDRIEARNIDVTVGDNYFQAKGALGKEGDRLQLNIEAANLAQLQFGFAGRLNAIGDLSGSLTKPRGRLQAQGANLVFFNNKIQSLGLKGQWETGSNGPLNADVELAGYAVGPVNLRQLNATVRGTQASHQFNGNFAGNILVREATADHPVVQWILDGQANGSGSITDDGWRGQVNQLNNVGQPNIQLEQPTQIAYENKEFKINRLIARVQEAQLNLDSLAIQGQRINSKGNVSNLVANRWLSWLAITLPFYPSDDFAVRGQWDIGMGTQPSGGFRFERERGNIALDARRRNLIELSDLNFQGRMAGTQMVLSGLLSGAKIGQSQIQGTLGLVNGASGWVVSGLSPLNLRADARLNELKQFNQLFGVNVRIDGQAQADLTLKGTLASWSPQGVITGQNLSFYHVDEGIRLENGVARLRVEPSQVVFEQFEAKGIEGTLSVKGTVGWGAGEKQGVNATMVMNQLRPFARPDREVVLSGTADLGFDGVRVFTIKGNVKVDKAFLDLPPTLAPSLDSDVRFAQTPGVKTKVDKVYVTETDINVDLGKNFRFKGRGADVYLGGVLRVHSGADYPELRANGTVQILRGTYIFYGQTLTVQRGLVTFSGPIDDPSLNIMATRVVGSTEVGVELNGTMADPHARLTSNPDMPDEEKLAWLLFGRSTSNLGQNDISAIAGAAAVLLSTDQGRKITDRFGIDNISVGTIDKQDGTSGTYVGVGKRFTDRFSVAYEQGVDTVSSVLKMTWTLSRNWDVILRGGTTNGIDLQYRRRFDRIWDRDHKYDDENNK